MNQIVPTTTPRLSRAQLHQKIREAGIPVNRDRHPLIVVGIRGYYLNSMGVSGQNDRGMYDDAIFIDSPNATTSFNGNTDPSSYRKGTGMGSKKGMASLKPGLFFAHRFGFHKGQYMALVQQMGEVTVIRDGSPNYEDTGHFGINIHKGGYQTTSSAGCQTIHPDQWHGFIHLVQAEAKRLFSNQWDTTIIPYILLEEVPSGLIA